MTDTSPAKYYLLFDRSDEFETQDKILYALGDPQRVDPGIQHSYPRCSLATLGRKLLIRSLEELQRGDFADDVTSPISGRSCGEEGGSEETSLTGRDDPKNMNVKSIAEKPWERSSGANSEWSCPLEILYQNYHLHIVVDFARTFDVSRNGTVFYDRIPDLMQSILTALSVTLEQRKKDFDCIEEWVKNTPMEAGTKEAIMQQVWLPHVLVSITLINGPCCADGVVDVETTRLHKVYSKAAKRKLVPPNVKIFTSQCQGTSAGSASVIPILARAEAREVVKDKHFIEDLEKTLAAYEKVSRTAGCASGGLSLESTIEYLVRTAPNTSKYCESIVLVANVNTCACSCAISFLEGMVRRKNIILSIVTLNRVQALDGPQLSSLTYFISRIGGFMVSIDFWRALAHPHLNQEWAERFEGSRCLVQQLFVQLVNRFPQWCSTPLQRMDSERLKLYDESNILPSKTCVDQATADAVLKSIAVARFNENWSVLVHHSKDDPSAHLLARATHYFHQGFLTLEYELNITPPVFYRSVSVQGTKTLVEQFKRADPVHCRANGVSHVDNFRLHLHEDLQGEELMLQLLLENASSKYIPLEQAYIKQLLYFTSANGVRYKWMNFSAVRSVAVIYDVSSRKEFSQISAFPGHSSASAFIENVMVQHDYILIGNEDGLVFIRQQEGYHPHLVQFFPVGGDGTPKDQPVGCFECRISFFFCGWRKRAEEVRRLIEILNTSASENAAPRTGKGMGLLAMSHRVSQCVLGVILSCISPRYELPKNQLSRPVTLITSGDGFPMFIPYPSHPFVLRKAFTFHWSFSVENADLRRNFFFFAVLRRQETFDCLVHLGSSLQAILMRKRHTEETGFELDFIDASSSQEKIQITRVITVMAHKASETLLLDVAHDRKIFSALYTFFEKVTPKKTPNHPESQRHLRVEALLPYISTDLANGTVKLVSPKALGLKGVRQLRSCLHEYMMGLDSSQIVKIHYFLPSFVRLLCSAFSTMQRGKNASKVVVSTKIVPSTNPVLNGSIVFALMIADDHIDGEKANLVEIALVWMNWGRLSQEITSRYQRQETPSHIRRGEREPGERANGILIRELTAALEVRASVHSTTHLLREIRIREAQKAGPFRLDEVLVSDIKSTTRRLTVYFQDMDITPLLQVVDSWFRQEDGSTETTADIQKRVLAALRDTMSSVLGSISKSYEPLPSLSFPREEVLGSGPSRTRMSHIPLLMKCAAVIRQRGEEKDERFWVPGVRSATASPALEVWGEGVASRARGKDRRTLHIRLFMLSSLMESRGQQKKSQLSTDPAMILRLLEEAAPPPDFCSSHPPFICMETIGKSTDDIVVKLQQVAAVVRDKMMGCCLQNSFRHRSYLEIRRITMSTGGEREQDRSDPTADTPPPAQKRYSLLSQHHPSYCTRIAQVTGLHTLLKYVVVPSLFATTQRGHLSENLVYTRHSAVFSLDPVKDVADVFQRGAEEDGIAVLPFQECRYIFIPNSDVQFPTWILIDLEFGPEDGGIVHIYWYHWDKPSSTEATKSAVALCEYVKRKMTQVCQLRLLKELRNSQKCTGKLLPPRWGDQFTLDARERQMQLSSAARSNVTTLLAPLQLQGKTVLELPLYYKLQNQCPRVLFFLNRKCTRLELVTIFNQQQCFMVADDVLENTFHCLRLIFLPSSETSFSTTELSPPLKKNDRCPRLVVQLYSAVDNPTAERPLKKIQNYAYLLAVQELQGQLNYAAQLSYADSLFLQHKSLKPHFIHYGNTGVSVDDGSDGSQALSLVVLHLCENNFKFFDISDAQSTYGVTSLFVEHYHLGESQRENETATLLKERRVWRFVKLVCEVMDVLVSCSVYLNPERRCVVLQPFLTKEPTERYNCESEKNILKELEKYAASTAVQMDFFSQSCQSGERIPLCELWGKMDHLLAIGSRSDDSKEWGCSFILRYKTFSLENLTTAKLPYLIESLCGAVELHGPCCFQHVGFDIMRSGPAAVVGEPTHIRSFPWKWFEQVQNHPLADCMEFYILCGFQVLMPDNQVAAFARVVPHIVLNLSVDHNRADESKDGILKPLGIASGMDKRIIMKVNMRTEELSVAFFNLRDAEALLKVVELILEEMLFQSQLLQSVLLQRLGYVGYDSRFSENDLACNCCGDVSNVIHDRKLALDSQNYRRPAKTCRFPPAAHHLSSAPISVEDHFVAMVEGLHNRGLVVNHIFSVDDGIKVLFNECLDMDLQQCKEEVMKHFFQRGFLKVDSTAKLKPRAVLTREKMDPKEFKRIGLNCRIVYLQRGWTAGALIACIYHRHIFTSHVIIEAQNARSSVQVLLAKCEQLLLEDEGLKDRQELAKAIIHLQSKSKQIFGSRVPNFLLFRENSSPESDLLEQNLPLRSDKNAQHAAAVDTMLRDFTNHLRRVCPKAVLIDLDPSSERIASDSVLVQRLRCRYGKVCVRGQEKIVRFCPHLYYAVIPVYSLLGKAYGDLDGVEATKAASPITSCGLLIVEVGFQVAHYALDIFSINGDRLPPSTVAKLAADLRQRLDFEIMLYDHQVQQISLQLRQNVSPLPGHQPMSSAVSTLISYYPSLPVGAQTAAASYVISDPLMTRVGADANEDHFIALLPEEHLTVSNTQKVYRFSGIVKRKHLEDQPHAEKKLQLYILLEPLERRSSAPLSVEDLHRFTRTAKRRLVHLLLRATHQERLDSAWQKFVSPLEYPLHQTTAAPPGSFQSPEEYHLLVEDSIKIFLPKSLMRARVVMESVDWPSHPAFCLRSVVEQRYPSYVLHTAGKSPRAYEERLAMLNVVVDAAGAIHPLSDEGSTHEKRSSAPRPLVLTLASLNVPSVLIALEGWLVYSAAERSYSVDVEELSVVRRVVPPAAGTPLTLSIQMREVLTPEEQRLLHVFQAALMDAMWAASLHACSP